MPRCANCGQEVPEGRFCVGCGKPLVSSSEIPTRLGSPASTPSSPAIDHGRYLPGVVVAGRYRIVAPLGRGGMGEVYRADDLKLGQAVALKFLPEGLERDGVRLERFLSEVRIARQIAHPNVCRVYDVGEVEGHHFLSMEYVDGEDLGSLLRRIGRLPGDKGVQIARQISAGLAAAHDSGVLHRDLKPANIMIDGRGRARITDFGLAAVQGAIRGREIRSGTPAYMSPEQLSGKEVTLRSDLYSLGLVLYELFTGKHPFKSSSPADLLRQQTTSSPASPSSVVEGLDPAVERIILRCLDADPDGRPGSALAVASALPGGDPLAAAIAAGETPSPELVAAAGEKGGLSPGIASAVLGAVLGGMILVTILSGKTHMLRLVPPPKSPEVLTEKARDLLHDLGQIDPPADSLSAFAFNTAYIEHLKGEASGADWPQEMKKSRPSPIWFGYRESPLPLQRLHVGGMGDWFADPPPTVPGMAEVKLDPQGRLVSFTRIPSPRSEAADPGPAPDWAPLLTAAGFAPADLKDVTPSLTPPVYADRRAAWEEAHPETPGAPIRIEAASLAGHPVAFQVSEPWSREAISREIGATPSGWLGALVSNLVFLIVLVFGGAVALRNLKLGRGDSRGALRFAIYLGVMRLLWLLGAHHLPFGDEQSLILNHVAWSMYRVAVVALIYLTMEPYARRIWPRMLVSWMRLLDGRFQDPLVGRDALVGALLGVIITLSAQAALLLGWWSGVPAAPPDYDLWGLESLRGTRSALASVIAIHTSSVLDVMIPLMFLLLLRLLLRKTWIAVVLTSVAGGFVFYPGSGSLPYHALSMLIPMFLFWLALFRFGLLAMFVAMILSNLARSIPLTLDLSVWYATPSVLVLLAMVALTLFAFRTSLAGRPLLRAPILDEVPAR